MGVVPHFVVVDGEIVATESSLDDAVKAAQQYDYADVVADGVLVWTS